MTPRLRRAVFAAVFCILPLLPNAARSTVIFDVTATVASSFGDFTGMSPPSGFIELPNALAAPGSSFVTSDIIGFGLTVGPLLWDLSDLAGNTVAGTVNGVGLAFATLTVDLKKIADLAFFPCEDSCNTLGAAGTWSALSITFEGGGGASGGWNWQRRGVPLSAPASIALFAFGLVALGRMTRRRRGRAAVA